jgi:hypothetical protein
MGAVSGIAHCSINTSQLFTERVKDSFSYTQSPHGRHSIASKSFANQCYVSNDKNLFLCSSAINATRHMRGRYRRKRDWHSPGRLVVNSWRHPQKQRKTLSDYSPVWFALYETHVSQNWVTQEREHQRVVVRQDRRERDAVLSCKGLLSGASLLDSLHSISHDTTSIFLFLALLFTFCSFISPSLFSASPFMSCFFFSQFPGLQMHSIYEILMS